MAVFSTNQNRQFYVAKSNATSTPATEGALQVIKEGNNLFFKYFGKDGLLRSDLIDINSIEYAKATPASAMARKLKKATITLNSAYLEEGKPISGQDYIVRIVINEYLASGEGNNQVKYGSVRPTKVMTVTEFYEALADSLTKNFSKEATPLLTFTGSADGVVIEEVEQPWVLGTMSSDPVNFEVYPTTITFDGEEVEWANKVSIVDGSKTIENGKKIADLEYFCMGERGDQYRGAGWPNVIPTKLMIDNVEQGYDVIDIHYSFSDTGVNSYKSEKDITIVGSNAIIKAIAAAIKGAGVSIVDKVTAE